MPTTAQSPPPRPAGPRAVSPAAVAAFQAARPRLFGIGYRVLGDAREAEDVVQETWLRWHGADRAAVRDVPAFLATTAMRLALNVAQSARARRETPGDAWRVDGVDEAADPAADVVRAEALEAAVRVLVQTLPPPERAAYVLREAFDYPYREIALALALSDVNARQLVTRARRRLGDAAAQAPPQPPARTLRRPRRSAGSG